MWLLKFLKSTLSSSLDSLSVRANGRLKFFVLFFLFSSVVSIIIVAAAIFVVLSIQYGDMYGLADVYYLFGIESFYYLYFPINVMVLIFMMGYAYREKIFDDQTFSLANFFKNIDATALGYFSIITVVLAGLVAYYQVNGLSLYTDMNDFDSLLYEMQGNESNPWMIRLLDQFTVLLIEVVPLAALGWYGIKLRKTDGVKYEIASLKPIVGFVILGIILTLVYEHAAFLIDTIRIPFESGEIPLILSLAVSLFMKAIYFMVLSTFAHYSFEYKKNESQKRVVHKNQPDLLDQ
jgi:hypothetical protein